MFTNFNQLKYSEDIRQGFEVQKEQFFNGLTKYASSATSVEIYRAEPIANANSTSTNLVAGDNSRFYNKMVIKSKDSADPDYNERCDYTDLVTITESKNGIIVQRQEMKLNTVSNACVTKYADVTDMPYNQYKLLSEFSIFPLTEVCYNDRTNATNIKCDKVTNLVDILITNESKVFGKVNVNKSKRSVYFGKDATLLIQ